MAVIEHQLQRIIADRLDRGNGDVHLPGLQDFLPRPVPEHLGRGRVNAQVLAAQ